jgi:ubiquitin
MLHRAKQVRANRADLKRVDEDTIGPAAQQPLKVCLAH